MYLGRYGGQPADVSLSQPHSRLQGMAEALSEIMREEHDTLEHHAARGR